MSRATYAKTECFVCKTEVSVAGGARYAHNMRHVREGKMRRLPQTHHEIALSVPYVFLTTKESE